MAEGLRFKVGADISEVKAATAALDKSFDQVGKSATDMGAKIQAVSKAVSVLPPATTKVVQAANNLNNALKKTKPGVDQASFALLNLGRVAQDAPFGIIGIANNLNPLFESFQRTSAAAGGFTGTLKALGASLLGAGGIGFALSLVTGALSFFALGNRGAKKESEELKKEIDVAAEKQREFESAVNAAAGAVIKQAASLNDLRDLLSLTTSATTELTQATINQGVAQFLFDQKNLKVQELLSAEIENQIKLRKLQRPLAGLKTFTNEITTTQITTSSGFFNERKIIDPTKKKIAELKDEIGGINELAFGLENIISGIFNKTFDKKVKVNADIEVKKLTLTPIDLSLPELPEEISPTSVKNANRIGAILGQEFITGFREAEERTDFSLIDAVADEKKLKGLQDGFIKTGQVISGFLTPAFNSFKDAIKEGKNAFQAFGQAILQSLAQVIQKLIQTAILAGIISLISGGASNAAKGGLSFAGAFKSAFGGFRAAGGPVQPGQSYVVGEEGPEIFRPNTSGSIISNSNLNTAGSFNNAGRTMQVVVSGRLRGSDMLLQNARASRTLSRTA